MLLKALKKLDNQNVHLYLAGDGTQLDNLRTLTQKLDLGSQVNFQGFMTHKQLKHLYRRMSFPLVLLEASDNLLPLLSTAVGDIKKMIPDGQHGFVAEVGSVDSITNALKSAVAMPPAELRQMAEREKKYVAANFSLAQQLASIEKVYQTLLAVH